MKCNVVSRCSYQGLNLPGWDLKDKNHFLTYKRLHLFQDMINSLKNQTVKDFKLSVITGSNEECLSKIKGLDFEGLNVEFIPSIKDLEIAEIQIQMDSDDQAGSDWVKHVIDTAKSSELDTFLINYIPLKKRYSDGELYNCYAKYGDNYPSMFTCIVQKKEKKFPAYFITHTKWKTLISNIINIEPGLVFLVVHGENVLTDIQEGKDKLYYEG